jgi:PAS domain S-box-containing protein
VVYENEFWSSEWAQFLPPGHVKLPNVLFAPLMIGGKAVGLLGLSNKEGGFTDKDADLAANFAEYAALSLLNSRNLENLANSEEKYRMLVDNAPVGIISVDLEGRILEVNRKLIDILGFGTARQIKAINLFTYEPLVRAGVSHAFRQCLQNSRVISGEFPYIDTQARPSFLRILLTPLLDRDNVVHSCQAVVEDVSDRKRAQDALQESEHQKQVILDGIPTNIVFVDNQLRIVWANRTASEYLGMAPEHMVGEKCYRVWSDAHNPCPDCPALLAFETRTAQVGEKKTPDGHIWDNRTEPVFAADGSLLGAIEIIHDITDKKQAEALMVQAEQFKAMADLAAGVAHNFNNLLQIVMGNASVARICLDEGSTEEALLNLDQIMESAQFGAETVKRLNTYVKTRTQTHVTEAETINLSELVNDAVEMSAPWWKNHPERSGTEIRVQLDCQEGCFVQARRHELFEVVMNLIKNAVEALVHGGDIFINTAIDGDQVVLNVGDTGIGMSTEDATRIFTPFFTTKLEAGTGLGLATSQSIVVSHNGRITVDSAKGEGTTLTVTLPLALPPVSDEPDPEPVLAHRTLSVMVVDDVDEVVRLLKAGLERDGHRVLPAYNGVEALAMYQRDPVEVVICDLAMPQMNGWQVGEAILRHCSERNIPKPLFIMLTGWGEQAKEVDKIRRSGVDVVLEKPADIPLLRDVILTNMVRQ